MTASVDCDRLMTELTDYLDGVVEADRRVAIDEHLDDCDDCRRVLEQFRLLGTWSARLASDVVSGLDDVTRRRLVEIFVDGTGETSAGPA